MLDRLNPYYLLTKPGIIRGNAVHVIAGSLLATTDSLNWQALLSVLVGTSLVIASACVVNNYMDRGIDAKMKRTKSRPSVTGKITFRAAMIFATLLAVLGFSVLINFTNGIVVVCGIVAYLLYVLAYGWAKRATIHSTLIGAIPGALPALAGYVAITGTLSWAAVMVFILILVWQMPHFYAISLFRKEEYASAGLPVLGVVKSFRIVRRYIIGYIILYIAVIGFMIAATIIRPAAGMLLIAGAIFWLCVALSSDGDEVRWAKSVFGASLVLPLLLLLVAGLNMFLAKAL